MDVRTLKDNDLDDSDRRLISDIETYGWHVVLIPEEDGTQGWAFSVGLYSTFCKPEVIVFGLPQQVSPHLINTVGMWARSVQTVSETDLYSGLIDKFQCTFRPVASQWYKYFVGAACWYYRRASFPLLQCFWPDRKEQFPWSPEFLASWLW